MVISSIAISCRSYSHTYARTVGYVVFMDRLHSWETNAHHSRHKSHRS